MEAECGLPLGRVMIRSVRRIVTGIALAAALASPGFAQRDTYSNVERIVAVGDIHGDLAAMKQVLSMAGLIDSAGKWSGGKTHLVQIGDLPDRGPDTRAVIETLMDLEKQAKKAGGAVHVLIGNHDAMNIYGDLRYVSPPEFAAFATPGSRKMRDQYYKNLVERQRPADEAAFRAKFEKETPLGWVEHRRAWSLNGPFGKWTAGHNAVLKINDTLFVHAGISPRVAGSTIADINRGVRAALEDPSTLEGSLATAEDGPLWYRGLATEPADAIGSQVDEALKAYGVSRIVFGHTPTRAPIVGRLGGRLIDVDTGLSRSYGGPKDCLILDSKGAFTMASGSPAPLSSQP